MLHQRFLLHSSLRWMLESSCALMHPWHSVTVLQDQKGRTWGDSPDNTAGDDSDEKKGQGVESV